MELLTILAVIIATMVLVALERDQIKGFLRVLLMLATGGVLIAPLQSFLGGFIVSVSRFTAAQMAHGESALAAGATPTPVQDSSEAAAQPAPAPAPALPGGFHLNRILAALALAAFTVVFFACEIEFNEPTFEALGLVSTPLAVGSVTDTALLASPAEQAFPDALSWVSTLALLGVMVVWGVLLLDLCGFTHFLPPVPARAERLLRGLAWGCVVLGLVTAIVMGAWRGLQLAAPAPVPSTAAVQEGAGLVLGRGAESTSAGAETPAAPQELPVEGPVGFDWFARVFLCSALPALVLVSGILSFTGVLWLLRYLVLFATGLLLAVPALLFFFVLPFWDNAVGHLLLAKDTAIDWLAGMGERLVNTFWPPFQEFRDASHRRARAAAEQWAPPASPAPEPVDEDLLAVARPLSKSPAAAPEKELVLAHHGNGTGAACSNGRSMEWPVAEARSPRPGADVAPSVETETREESYDLRDLNWGWPELPDTGGPER